MGPAVFKTVEGATSSLAGSIPVRLRSITVSCQSQPRYTGARLTGNQYSERGSRSGYGASVETWDAIRARRNVRAFTDVPVSVEHLEAIAEAGRRAPSSRNGQPWDFIVCTDSEQLQRLALVWRGAGHVAGAAAAFALIAPEVEDAHVREVIQYDLGQVTMSMALVAADLGIGSGHAAVADQELAQAILGFPDGRFCAWLLAVGYPSDRPLAPIGRPNRRPTPDVVHWDRW